MHHQRTLMLHAPQPWGRGCQQALQKNHAAWGIRSMGLAASPLVFHQAATRTSKRCAATQSSQQPEDASPHTSTQQLRDCAELRQELQELQRRLADAEQEVQEFRKWKERRYIVDPLAWDDRVDDAMKKRVKAVVSKWHRRLRHHTEPEHRVISMSRDKDKPEIVYDSKLQTFKLLNAEEVSAQQPSFDTQLPWILSSVISSALLLYRLRCLFHVEVKDVDYYKSVWEAEVVHKASGHILGFGEHKGAASVYLSADHPNRQFVEDGVELINLLCDPRCPHTYDGTVAGSVA